MGFATTIFISECLGHYWLAAYVGWIATLSLFVVLLFPFFLRCLKALSKFIRNKITDICDAFDREGLTGATAVLKGITMEVFIEWRWGTFKNVCDMCSVALSTVRGNSGVVAGVVRRMKDTSFEELLSVTLVSE